MAYEHILLDVSPEGTAVLTLNRPQKRNAFNAEVIAELTDAFETLSKNPECRLVLIRGNGPVFSAGADLEWMKAASHYTVHENEEDAYRHGRNAAPPVRTAAGHHRAAARRGHGRRVRRRCRVRHRHREEGHDLLLLRSEARHHPGHHLALHHQRHRPALGPHAVRHRPNASRRTSPRSSA